MEPSTISPISRDEAAARSGTYRLLARLWLREVDRDLLRELRSPPLSESFVEAGGILPPGDDESTSEQLAIDYCRLFVGPTDHLPPYQSVWQSGRFQAATTASMQAFMEVVGYDPGALPSGMMLDHLGVQLDMMGHILDQISTSHSSAESVEGAGELSNAVFTRHLLWPTELLQAAARRATTDLYRSAILLTRSFLNSEKKKGVSPIFS